MGRLRYDSASDQILIDDVELAHLRIVIGEKLRRGESFMMSWHTGTEGSDAVFSAWIHPAVPLLFVFDSSAPAPIDSLHIEELNERINSNDGLVLHTMARR
ncbi:hypothetical protein [Microbacterium sp. 179-I 3D4 NHS]|uniref:DUF7882 family protein n=1 Tax=Microbacterium sp. 179-I 3D4 NHS TaxID=3142381 RepID=UPI0039A14832